MKLCNFNYYFLQCRLFDEIGEDFISKAFTPESRGYIPFWYKKNGVALSEAPPNRI